MIYNQTISLAIAVGVTDNVVERIDLPNRSGRVWRFEGMEATGRTTIGTPLVSQAYGILRLHPLSASPIASTTGIADNGSISGGYVVSGAKINADYSAGGIENPLIMDIGEDQYLVDGYQLSLSLYLAGGATGNLSTILEVAVNLTEVSMTKDVQAAMLKQLG